MSSPKCWPVKKIKKGTDGTLFWKCLKRCYFRLENYLNTGQALVIWTCRCSLFYKRASKSAGAHSTRSLKIRRCKRWCPKDLRIRPPAAPVLTHSLICTIISEENHHYLVLDHVTGGELFDDIVERKSYRLIIFREFLHFNISSKNLNNFYMKVSWVINGWWHRFASVNYGCLFWFSLNQHSAAQ